MRTHTVIDGNAFYEVDDECMERLQLKKRDKTGAADIQADNQDICRFWPEGNGRKYKKNR